MTEKGTQQAPAPEAFMFPRDMGAWVRGHSVREAGKHGLFALVMGVIGAFASIFLCLCVQGAATLFKGSPWLIWLLPVLGAASLLVYRACRLPLDMTTHRVMVQMRQDKPVSRLLAPSILLGTCATSLGGGSVGKEAAALQMGASLGSLVSRPFRLRSVYKRNQGESMEGYAAATGMAATFSALFFAPLGSALFVMELSRFKRSINKHIVSIVLACLVAYLIARAFGIGDAIERVALPALSWGAFGQCLVVGICSAVVGALFSGATDWVHDLTWRISKNCYLWVVVGGLLFAALVTWCGWMPLTGAGGDTLAAALQGRYGPWDFAVKALLTVICLGFWFKGGEIMPSFCVGGLLGASCTVMTGGDPGFGAVVGAMALFASFSGCPLAAFLMGCEIFGWGAAPWLAVAIGATALANPSMGMYGAGLEAAVRTRWRTVLKGSYRRFVEEEQQEAASENAVMPGVVAELQDAVTAVGRTLRDSAQQAGDGGDAMHDPPGEHSGKGQMPR